MPERVGRKINFFPTNPFHGYCVVSWTKRFYKHKQSISKGKTCINYWVPAKRGTAIVRIGYIRSTMLMQWGYAFGIPGLVKRQWKS